MFVGSARGGQLILSKITVTHKRVNLLAKNRLYHRKREFIQVISNIAVCGLRSHAEIGFLVRTIKHHF